MRTYKVRERSAFRIMMRLATPSGYLTIAETTSITWAAFPESEWTTGGTPDATGTLTVATALSDTLSTDGWNEDAVGYNLSHDVTATVLMSGGPYIFTYRITPVTGAAYFADRIRVEAESIYMA
jgi:hypothetical protein